MRSLVNSYFKKYRIPLSVIGTNSISRLVFTDQKFKNRMERDYLEQGTQSKQIEFRKKMHFFSKFDLFTLSSLF